LKARITPKAVKIVGVLVAVPASEIDAECDNRGEAMKNEYGSVEDRRAIEIQTEDG
jgi:hypothetical protein